jgi:ATP-dependent Clp endopeptidase proteolytic subunit ClpP
MGWFEIKAKSDIAEVWLYDEIGKDFFGDGVTAKEFLTELNAIKAPKIDMHINSPGGAVFDGAAIYNAVKRHPATVTTYIDGIAASIASVIALAGDKIIMAENAIYMMHNPFGFCMGRSEDMRKTADILDKVCGTMIGAYSEKSGKGETEIRALLDAETWMDAAEAKAAGFVDEIGDEMEMAACAQFVPSMEKMGFKRIPQAIKGEQGIPSPRQVERLLRGAGFSSKQAKTLLAKGYSGDARDGGGEEVVPAPKPQQEVEPPTRAEKVMEMLLHAERLAPSY